MELVGALVKEKTRLYVVFCQDVNTDDTFCSFFFYIPSYVEEWTMNNVRGCKGYLSGWKVYSTLFFILCYLQATYNK